MKQKAYRQNPTVIDLSKKARPPPGETTLIYMNCLIIWILLTMPMSCFIFVNALMHDDFFD